MRSSSQKAQAIVAISIKCNYNCNLSNATLSELISCVIFTNGLLFTIRLAFI